MKGLAYACAVVLAAVLVRAAVAKAARPEETVAGFAALGVPAPGVTARAVPLAELVVAVALLAAPRVGAVAALVLLAAFTAFIATALRRGMATPCNCFGAARAEPVSRNDLLRNALLEALAVAALFASEPVLPNGPAIGVVLAAVALGAGMLKAARR